MPAASIRDDRKAVQADRETDRQLGGVAGAGAPRGDLVGDEPARPLPFAAADELGYRDRLLSRGPGDEAVPPGDHFQDCAVVGVGHLQAGQVGRKVEARRCGLESRGAR